MSKSLIGVFDSGIGGLTVLRHIRQQLPGHDYCFIADSAFTPYGEKTREQVIQRSISLCRTLLDRGAKILVVACNTATALAVERLRQEFSLPIVAMEPAVKPAVQQSSCKRTGVIATTMTLSSERYSKLIERFASDGQVYETACPGLVEQVENMQISHPQTERLLQQYLNPLLERDIDTLVLGCTHYPFLSREIRRITGPTVEIIDTGEAVALELKRQVVRYAIPASKRQQCQYYTTGDLSLFSQQLQYYWPYACQPARISVD